MNAVPKHPFNVHTLKTGWKETIYTAIICNLFLYDLFLFLSVKTMAVNIIMMDLTIFDQSRKNDYIQKYRIRKRNS